MNIVLIGFMGSGKKTVGMLLSKKLKMDYVEMDEAALKKSKRKSINEIFDKDGEIKFREIEIETASELAKKDNCVIATGGGVVYNKVIIDHLKENGFVVCLRVKFSEAKRRLEKSTVYPLFRNVREARKIYNFRKPLYREYADSYVRTDEKSPEDVRDAIIEVVKENA